MQLPAPFGWNRLRTLCKLLVVPDDCNSRSTSTQCCQMPVQPEDINDSEWLGQNFGENIVNFGYILGSTLWKGAHSRLHRVLPIA